MDYKEFLLSHPNTCEISSLSNRKVVEYAKLKDEKYRKASGLFLAEGVKLTKEALRYADVVEVLVNRECFLKPELEDTLYWIAEQRADVCLLPNEVFQKISTEKSPQGVIAIVKTIEKLHKNTDLAVFQEGKRLLMLDEIRDPGNLGTILRSAEALGINGVILSSCADIYNPKTVRAAMGTLFRLSLYITKDGATAVQTLQSKNRRVIGATLGENHVTLGRFETRESDCVVIGNEGHGISPKVSAECDFTIRIPMSGECESLNAAAATVCILWEYYRKNLTL